MKGQLRMVLHLLILHFQGQGSSAVVGHFVASHYDKRPKGTKIRLLTAYQGGSSHTQGVQPQRGQQMLACSMTC